MAYIFEQEFTVRDYECDLQGIVNNANYQHYMEHTRHEFIKTIGLNFAELHRKGIDVVVSKVEIRFKRSLVSNDKFVCKLKVKKDGFKYVFYQDIYRLPDNILCNKGIVESVSVINGKLGICKEVDEALIQKDQTTE